MFEHFIEIEKNIQPINVVLDRMKEFLREELQTREIYEYMNIHKVQIRECYSILKYIFTIRNLKFIYSMVLL